MLRRGLLELGLRLRYLILQVFPSNVRKRKAFFCIISSPNVASSDIVNVLPS